MTHDTKIIGIRIWSPYKKSDYCSSIHWWYFCFFTIWCNNSYV